MRRRRTHHFPAAIFKKIAWEILLSCCARERPCGAAMVPKAPACPSSVTARWINHLVSSGLIVRSEASPNAQTALALTGKGILRIETCRAGLAQLLTE